MRALVKEKDLNIVKSKLESALYQRVSSMKDARDAAESLKKGTLQKFGKAGKGSAKSKYVQVSLHKGTTTGSGFEPGAVRLSYSETENSATLSTCKVTAVKTADNMAAKWTGLTFSLEAIIDNDTKLLVFACKDTKERDEWIAVVKDGFKRVETEAENMQALFQLTLNFNKEKLGIRVEEQIKKPEGDAELCLDEKKEDIPAPTEEDKADTATAEDIPAPAADDAAVEEKEADPEPPCTLFVTAISDKDLEEKGLRKSMSLLKLNDIEIDGLPYSKQLAMLTGTDKPFTITFSGPSYLKLGQDNNVTAFPAILKQLTAAEKNDAQASFLLLIKGSQFEKEYDAAEDKNAAITALLSNQHKLSTLLTSVEVHSADL